MGNIKYCLFSATFPKTARDLAKEYLSESHVRFRVGRAGSTTENIKQVIVEVETPDKRNTLLELLNQMHGMRTIVFVNSRKEADNLDDFLFNMDLPVTSIHSERTQQEREAAMRSFRQGKAPILIATGVSARGIDVQNVQHVINYDLPSMDHGGIEEYTHRIGKPCNPLFQSIRVFADMFLQVVLAASAIEVSLLHSSMIVAMTQWRAYLHERSLKLNKTFLNSFSLMFPKKEKSCSLRLTPTLTLMMSQELAMPELAMPVAGEQLTVIRMSTKLAPAMLGLEVMLVVMLVVMPAAGMIQLLLRLQVAGKIFDCPRLVNS